MAKFKADKNTIALSNSQLEAEKFYNNQKNENYKKEAQDLEDMNIAILAMEAKEKEKREQEAIAKQYRLQQIANDKKLKEDTIALAKQQQEDKLAEQKKYLNKEIKQTDPAIYKAELKAKADFAEEAKQNPSYIAQKEELNNLLLGQKKAREIVADEIPTIDSRFVEANKFTDNPATYLTAGLINSPIHIANALTDIVNKVKSVSFDLVNSAAPKSKEELRVEKLQKDLAVFDKPKMNLKHTEIKEVTNKMIDLYKKETNPLTKHKLEIEIWKNEQSLKEIDNTIEPSSKWVAKDILGAIVGTTDFDKDEEHSLGSELNRLHIAPRLQGAISEGYNSRRDLEDKYQDLLVAKPNETPEQTKARLAQIPEQDLALLESYSLRDEAISLIQPYQSFGARQATNMRGSLDMVAGMMLSEVGAGLVSTGVGKVVSSSAANAGRLAAKEALAVGETTAEVSATGTRTTSVAPKTFLEKGYIEQVEQNILAKGKLTTKIKNGVEVVKNSNSTLAKTASMGLDFAQLEAKVQAMNLMDPSFVNREMTKGSYIDRDDDGNIKSIYLQDKYYDLMNKMTFGYDTPDGQHIDGEKDSYVKRAAVLNRIQNRTEKQEDELDHIEQKLGKRVSLGETTFEEDMESYKPVSKAEAYIRGSVKNTIEAATEVYTGPLLGKIGKGLVKAPYGIGKYATKLANTVEKIGSKITTAKANVINTNKLFKYIDKNMTKINMPTFSGHTITGGGEEFVEEWIAGAANSIIAGDPKEFMDTTFDAQSNIDIGLQTAFMQLGFGGMSVASTNAKLKANSISKSILDRNMNLQKLHEQRIIDNQKEIDLKKKELEDTSLSEEDKAVKTNLIEDLETQNINSKGSIAGIKKSTQNARPMFQDLRDYTNARNETREVNNVLRTAHLDSDINKVMNMASMSATDLDAQKEVIVQLRKEGSDKAADLAEKVLFNNVVGNAIKTGTLKELKSSLEAASTTGTLTAKAQENLVRASQHVAHLEEVAEKNQKHPYLNNILGMESEAFGLSEELETAKRNVNNISSKAVDAIKDIHPNKDFNINTIYDDTDDTFSEAELKQMNESNSDIENHKLAYDIQNQYQERLSKTKKVINTFKNEAKQEVNKKNIDIDVRKQLIEIQKSKDDIPEDNVTQFDKEGKLIITKELIDNIFENNRNKYVGDWKTSNKISEDAFETMKENYFKVVDMMDVLKKSQDVQSRNDVPVVDNNQDIDNPKQRIPINSKRYKSFETATNALKQYEKPRKVKKGTHEVVQVGEEFIISKKLETQIEEDTPLEVQDNGTIEKIDTEEEVQGLQAIADEFSEAINEAFDPTVEHDVMFDIEDSIDNNRFTPRQMELASAYLKSFYNEMLRKAEKKDITFEKVFEQMFHYGNNKKAVEMFFPTVAIAWRNMGNELTQAEQANLYDKYYGTDIDRNAFEESYLETFNNIYTETVVIEPIQTSLPVSEVIIPSTSVTNYNDTDAELDKEIQASLEAEKQMSDKERQSITPKAAFSSIKYETYIDEKNGDVHRVSVATDFRDTSGVNFKELLDYDKYYTGYQAGVRISTEDEWQTLSISDGRDENGNVKLIPFLDWKADLEKRKQEELNNKEQFVSSKKRQEKEGGNYKEISINDIDLEASGLENLEAKKIVVLEERRLNLNGQKVATVRIVTENGSDVFEIFLNTDKINAKYDQEFTDRVPMFLLNEQGEKISYLNDTAWYDTVNVYNPNGSSANQKNPSEAWQRHINKGIENVRQLRNNVKAGLTTVTIERNSEEGTYLKLKKEAGQPTISISESNPQSNIAVASSTDIKGLKFNNKELVQKIKNGSAIFLNKPSEIINSHTYYISRMGTNVLPDGRKVETYRAFPVLRTVTENQIESVRNAYKIVSRYTFAMANKDKGTPEQRLKHNKTIQNLKRDYSIPILNATGIDIFRPFADGQSTGIIEFTKLHFQATIKSLQEVDVKNSDNEIAYERLFAKYTNAELAKQDSEGEGLLAQHTLRTTILNGKGVIEVTPTGFNIIEKDGKPISYEEYIKDNVKTDVKGLNIGTPENPKYITVIQPIINLIGKSVPQTETKTSEKIAEVTAPIIETITATTQAIQQNPVQVETVITDTEKRNIEEFFNKLGINVDYDEIDQAIDNLDALNNLFNTTGNLDYKEEQSVKQYFIGNITKYIIENKIDITKPITNEIKKKIYDELEIEIKKIANDRIAEINTVKENLKSFKEDNVTKKLLETANTHLENFKTISDEFETIFNKSFDKLKIDSKVIEDEDENNDNVGIEEKNFSKDSIETDMKKGVTPNLRLFLNSISRYDKQGNKITTYMGLDSYMEFNEIFNQLIKNIAIGIDIPSDYKVLIETLENSKAPFIKDILEKLSNADEQVQNTFSTTFTKHSLNSKSAQYSKINNVTKLKMIENDSNEGKRVVKKEYLNNLKVSNVYNQNSTVNLDYVNDLLLRYASLYTKYPTLIGLDEENTKTAQNEIRAILEDSGLIMQNNTWDDILKGKFFNKEYKTLNDLYILDSGGLLKDIVKSLEKFKEGAIYDDKTNILSNLGGVTNAIIRLEVSNDTNLNSTSFRDSGKNISKLVPTKYITDKVMDLKRSATSTDKKLIENLQSLSYSKDSVMLELLDKYPDFANIFNISHNGLEAMKKLGKPLYGKTGITDISDLDYFLATFTGFQDRRSERLIGASIDDFPIRIANMLNLTMSDKSTTTILQTGVFDFMISPLSFDIDDKGNMILSQYVKNLMIKQLVKPELERIANFYNNVKGTNISDYDKAAKIFHLIPLLNTVKNKEDVRLIDELAVTDNIDADKLIEKYKEQFSDIISQVVEEEVNHFKEVAGDKLIEMFDSEYFTEMNIDKAMYDFVLNSMIHQADLFKVFAGDIANYAKDKQSDTLGLTKEEIKKGEINEVGLNNKATDEQYVSINKTIGVNLGKRLALLIAPGNKIANSYNEKYHQIFLQDTVDISENAKYLMDLYYPKKDKLEAHKNLEQYDKIFELVNKYEQGILAISPDIIKVYKDKLKSIRESLQKEFPSIKDYFDIESTDAQEYTTAKEHVNILYRLGRLNPEQYERIMSNIENDIHLSKEDLKFVLQPIKPVHTGTYYNEKWDVNRVVYIKTSSFPLLKQFTATNKLDALRVKMEELEKKTSKTYYQDGKNITVGGVRASYKTGNKVGAVKSNNEVNPFDVQSLEKIFNGFDATTNTFDENGMNNSVLLLDRNNFRIQQDVPFKSDKKKVDTVAMSTQFFKMLFGDGVIEQYDEKDREKFATFSLDGKMVTGKELYNHYANSFENLMNVKKQQLFKELEMSPEGEIVNQLAFTQKLQAMLVKEATEKGYSLKSVRGLTIEQLEAERGFYYDFKTPLWLSSDSNRYEALLNSLITNRILQHKIPGNSYIAGSESGFRMKENLDDIDQSRIIYLDNYNGKELQGTHTTSAENGIVFHKAQVFVPSKFKTNKNELIDLFEGFNEISGSIANAKYLKRNENGSLGLKENMIDKELLNLFSFRTPTSSHVSGASIEIAGFLPSIQGDLMIVPKNFTKQKGLDYDVDKEGTYMLNHFVNKKGQIKVLEKTEDITEFEKSQLSETDKTTISELLYYTSESISSKDKIEKYLDNLILKLDYATDNQYVSELKNQIDNLYTSLKIETNSLKFMQDEIKNIRENTASSFNKKLAENEFIKSHLAVYNNPSANIQQKINKVLSIDVAKKQAEQLEKNNIDKEKKKFIDDRIKKGLTDTQAEEEYNRRQSSFTMLSYLYQRDKMNFGAIGKTAIGVYANATTFSSLLQQSEHEISLADNGLIQIGDIIFDGRFGKIHTLSGGRTIADVLAERENIATDNEKEQVLTKVGINAETINVDALLTLAGFDIVDYTNSITKEKSTISIPFYLLSQPAITNFNNTLKNAKGVLGKPVNKEQLINQTILELSNKKISYVKNGNKYNFVNTKTGDKINDFNGSVLTPENLVNGVKSNGLDKEVQAATFMTFIDLNEKAKVLQKIQSVINTNDLGKSMIGSKLKYDKLKTISENGIFNNVEKLIGDFINKKEVSEKPEGYYDIGDYYIKPTTPQGQIVVNGLHIGNNIFKSFFPFQNETLNNTLKEIIESSGKSSEDISDETYEEIIDELKKYIFSSKGNNLFEGDADAVRFDLFKDTDDHKSLSTYIHSLIYNKQNTKALKSIKENALLKQLSFNLDFDNNVESLSTMFFNNTDSGTNSQEDLYNAIPELIKNNYKLPDKNGMSYNTRMLGTDLVAYAYLEGGVQAATQFVKLIPVEVLETIGKYTDVKQKDGSIKRTFVTANTQLQKYNSGKYNKSNTDIFTKILGVNENSVTDFTKQYFQHNPTKVKTIRNKEILFDVENEEINNLKMFTLNPKFLEGSRLPFLRLNDYLYEHNGNLDYYKIATIGGRGISEYKKGDKNAVNFDVKEKEITENNTLLPTKNNDVTDEFEDIKNINDALGKIQDLSLDNNYEFIKVAAKFLNQFQDATTTFEISSTRNSAGLYNNKSNNVTLHGNTLTDANKTAMTLLHEYVHSITSREVMKYYEADGITLKTDVSIPSHVLSLNIVFSKFRQQFAKEIAEITAKKQGDNKQDYTNDEKNIYYAGYNIKEFMAVALTSADFQAEMNKIKYLESGKSFIEKILDSIMKIVDSIYPELKKDSIAHEAVSKSMQFIIEEHKNPNSSKTMNLITGEDLSLLNIIDNQLGLQAIDTSKEVDNFQVDDAIENIPGTNLYRPESIRRLTEFTSKQQQDLVGLNKGRLTIQQFVDKLQLPKEEKQLVINSYNNGNTWNEITVEEKNNLPLSKEEKLPCEGGLTL